MLNFQKKKRIEFILPLLAPPKLTAANGGGRPAPARHSPPWRDGGGRLCGEHSCGFTLIELMVVLVVIAILGGITLSISKYITIRARQANQRIYIEKIKSALEDYRAAYGEYPITPPYDGAERHYDDPNYYTECYYTGNSPFTNVNLTTTNVEWITADDGTTRPVDYCLTYPLMLKQLKEKSRPFMDFKVVTVAFLVYNTPGDEDIFKYRRRRKLAGGTVEDSLEKQGIYGKPVNRPKAIDPVSQKQWQYISSNGLSYILTNHIEADF